MSLRIDLGRQKLLIERALDGESGDQLSLQSIVTSELCEIDNWFSERWRWTWWRSSKLDFGIMLRPACSGQSQYSHHSQLRSQWEDTVLRKSDQN